MSFRVGDRVSCQFEGALGGDTFYPGVVESVNADGSCNILYDDGDRETNVQSQFIAPTSTDGQQQQQQQQQQQLQNGQQEAQVVARFSTGDRVECQFEAALGGATYYPGHVESVAVPEAGAVLYNVVYDDGDRETGVEERFLRPLGLHEAADLLTPNEPAAATSVPPSDGYYAAGDRIECQFEGALGGLDWFLGHIEAVNAESYNIVFDDGDREIDVAPQYIRLPATEPAPAPAPATAAEEEEVAPVVDVAEPIAEPDAEPKVEPEPVPVPVPVPAATATAEAEAAEAPEPALPEPELVELEFRAGDAIECQFEGALDGDEFYPGHIERVDAENGVYDILYEDGDRETSIIPQYVRRRQQPSEQTKTAPVAASPVLPTPEESSSSVPGQEVPSAVASADSWIDQIENIYPGNINSLDAVSTRYNILYDDGDREDNVEGKYIRRRQRQQQPEQPPSAAAVALAFRVADPIECQFEGALGGDEFYPGHIERVDAENGVYDILYEDGDREPNVAPQYVRPRQQTQLSQQQPPQPVQARPAEFQVGDLVECQFEGHLGGTEYFPGRIHSLSSNVAPQDVQPPQQTQLPQQQPPQLVQAQPAAFQVGDLVECQFEGHLGGTEYFPGRIHSLSSNVTGRYNILYDDGDPEADVGPQYIRLREPAAFSVGSLVQCQFEGHLDANGDFYDGRISARNPDGTYNIDYDDGDRETNVLAQFIRPRPTGTTATGHVEPVHAVPAFQIGQPVDCLFEGALGGTDFYAGHVESVGATPDGAVLYTILYEDGEREANVAEQYVQARAAAPAQPATAAPAFQVGDVIDCQFEGALGGLEWYAGQIERVNAAAQTFDVLFDDGDREANVAPPYIRNRA